jgi:hypothetical protein
VANPPAVASQVEATDNFRYSWSTADYSNRYQLSVEKNAKPQGVDPRVQRMMENVFERFIK